MRAKPARPPAPALLAAGLLASACFANAAEDQVGKVFVPEALALGPARLVMQADMAATALNPARAAKPRLRRSPRTLDAVPFVGSPSSKAAAAPAAAPPALTGPVFSGANNSLGDLSDPPDTHGAAGPSHYVEIVNTRVYVYQTYSGGQAIAKPLLKKKVDLRAFFGVPQLFGDAIFDGRVLYDSRQGRWLFVAADQSDAQNARLVLAISKTADPLGSYYTYRFAVGPTSVGGANFWDFPMLGHNKDALFISGDLYQDDSYIMSAVLAIPKANVYQGPGGSLQGKGALFKNLAGTLATPVVLDASADAFFLAAQDGGNLHLYKGSNLANTSLARLKLQAKIPVPHYAGPAPASQPGIDSPKLDASDARFVNASTQSGKYLWNIHAVELKGHAKPKFYKIDTALNKIAQSGYFSRSGSSDDFNASLAANTSGDVFVTWTTVDAVKRVYPGVVVSGFPAGQYSNTPAITQGRIMAGSQYSYLGDGYDQRWGDYSAVSLDLVASGTCAAGQRAWVVNQKANSESAWGSAIGRIGFC